MKSNRTLTIEPFNPAGRQRAASLIRLKGNWLQQAGFPSGAKIQVHQPQPGVLELRVAQPIRA